MMAHPLTAKTKSKIKYMRFKTYRGLKVAAQRMKTFFFDPNDLAPGDDFPIGPLLFSKPKEK